ncbi:hypothetical protein WME99_32780 [Sorangium sp. So ce136]|uniref:hypothetical protein n=1 Tax=Sorangium sp. So ce136 TaxID=3133284 RepID=UPI003F10587A
MKVLATVEGDDAAAHAWIPRLGFDPTRTRIHPLPARPWPAPGDPAELLGAADAVPARLLGLLACACGRLREDEITTALGAPIEGALAGIEPHVAVVEGTFAFRWNAARREVEERLDGGARETSTRRLLSLPPDGYPCAYARAHMEQAAAPFQAFAALVTEEHLAHWMARPEGYLGFVADLERVRRRAVEALASGHEAAAGLAFDGLHLWMSGSIGDVFRLSMQNGGIQQHFPIAQSDVRNQGIAHRAGERWVAGTFEQMVVYSPVDGALLGAVTTPEGAHISPEDLGQLCFVGDELVVLSQRGLTYYRPERVAD